MKGRMLAALVLSVAITSLTRADYIVIIANLNARADGAGTGTGLGTGEGTPGLAGGGRGGLGGMTPPGGMGPPGGLGSMGPPGGMMGGMSGMSGMMGGLGGMMGGYGTPGEDASDDSPHIVVAVVEVGNVSPTRLKQFEAGLLDKQGMQGMSFNHRWGGKASLRHKTAMYEVVPLKSNSGQMLQSASQRFVQRQDRLGATATTGEQIDLARWGLEHGLLTEFAKVMDNLAAAEGSKNDPVVKAYVKTKADLERPVSQNDAAAQWKSKLLDNYRVAETPHYALLHNHQADTFDEVKPVLDRLEKSFKCFYYWWALRGETLTVPANRQVAVLTEKTDDFRRLKKHLTASPVMADSFFARREGLSVFAGKRNDDAYSTLDRISKPYWEKNYDRKELLRGSIKSGIPNNMLKVLMASGGQPVEEIDNARFFALLMKAMEEEWEATGISHEASRQLVYASGLLPRNVHAPEWLTFGLGSFFEVPLQSPFGGVGAASPYWMPRFRESYKAKHYNKDRSATANPSSYDALVRTVTDGGFRAKPEPVVLQPGDTPEIVAQRAKEATLRRARASAWSLTFFLAQRELAGLKGFLKELSRMPRDVELDDKVLLTCFAKAFDSLNADKSVNKAKLTSLADRWVDYVNKTPLEAAAVHEKIRAYFKQVTRVPPAGQGNPGQGTPGFPGGNRGGPGGGNRGGPGP